ncbi:hypothetical protein BJX61DRAFT_534843 [Aspergillus egyptiacus]|nr:hypothetical protein BJX61DRAFT_534843 [Aspergillus egyptiacus]
MSTPSPSTATPRPSNLAVPATQGTAPVVKFRCLFTHDTRRKAKRWQDGFLRYHTFNKRVMVYDNSGYFIGDLHWRAPEGIQDGDELELERGVLIQVCEQLEKTETDISSLYKNKAQQSPSHPGETPPSSARSTARPLSSQQASRSLNDLLGIRKTPTPRLLSPYEQRHRNQHTDAQQSYERPAKRQRAASPEASGGQQDIVDLSDLPPRQHTTTVSRPNQDVKNKNGQTTTSPTPRISTDSSKDAAPKQPATRPATQNPVPTALSNPRLSSVTEAPVNPLRLSSERPRKKLMYQESSQSSVRGSQTRPLLSQAHAQSNERSSSPIIIIDDDDPIPEPPQPSTAAPIKPEIQSQQKPVISDAVVTPQSAASRPARQHQPEIKREETPPKPRATGLRKSYSDPTTINSLHARPLPAASPLNPSIDQCDEQGPWTSEALDLFDFWPPGRPKPT